MSLFNKTKSSSPVFLNALSMTVYHFFCAIRTEYTKLQAGLGALSLTNEHKHFNFCKPSEKCHICSPISRACNLVTRSICVV